MVKKTTDRAVAGIARELFKIHQEYESAPDIFMKDAEEFLELVLGALFPQLTTEKIALEKDMEAMLGSITKMACSLVQRSMPESSTKEVSDIVIRFMEQLPEIASAVRLDAERLKAGDPAAHSLAEVIKTYPGCLAVTAHRIAHPLYCSGVPIFPRILAEYAHRLTGIDIHPGARIGKSFYVDHGTGVVIGGTSIIGDHVNIYQGVTLGALKVDEAARNQKRHPTIEDNVTIYANATILGGETVVGHDSVIGGNVWITQSILPYSRVMYKSSDKAASGLDYSI